MLPRTPCLNPSSAPTSRHRTQVRVLWTPHVALFKGCLEAPAALLLAIQENRWSSPVDLFCIWRLALPLSLPFRESAIRRAIRQGSFPRRQSVRLPNDLRPMSTALRYEDIDAETVERVKTHVIDVIGCGIGAFDERPVGICREVALAVGGKATIIGTDRRTSWRLLPTEPPSATSTSTTPIPDALRSTQATTSRPVSRWRRPSGSAPVI